MIPLRPATYAALGVAYLHLVFGAVVRITGSGMGCGDHWPKCYGRWFPPLERRDLVIEVTHRYLAAMLILATVLLVVAAWRRRHDDGVGGRGGVLRAASGALAAVVATALVGAVTVRFGNPPWATVFHWTLAMTVFAMLAAAAVRAGGFGAQRAQANAASGRTRRAATAAAALALAAVVMGGLTAKVPNGAVACLEFPHCGRNAAAESGAVHVQMTHRVIAFLLVLHLAGVAIGVRRRAEHAVIRRAAFAALAVVVLQIVVAGAMIGMQLPPALRSLHQAVGVLVWLSCFLFAYLARPRQGALPATVPAGAWHPASASHVTGAEAPT